jgi:hypothetical protein
VNNTDKSYPNRVPNTFIALELELLDWSEPLTDAQTIDLSEYLYGHDELPPVDWDEFEF